MPLKQFAGDSLQRFKRSSREVSHALLAQEGSKGMTVSAALLREKPAAAWVFGPFAQQRALKAYQALDQAINRNSRTARSKNQK